MSLFRLDSAQTRRVNHNFGFSLIGTGLLIGDKDSYRMDIAKDERE